MLVTRPREITGLADMFIDADNLVIVTALYWQVLALASVQIAFGEVLSVCCYLVQRSDRL